MKHLSKTFLQLLDAVQKLYHGRVIAKIDSNNGSIFLRKSLLTNQGVDRYILHKDRYKAASKHRRKQKKHTRRHQISRYYRFWIIFLFAIEVQYLKVLCLQLWN